MQFANLINLEFYVIFDILNFDIETVIKVLTRNNFIAYFIVNGFFPFDLNILNIFVLN